MRRTYISPEFNYVSVNGTFNMVEKSSFFGSKMLEIADSIQIKNESIVYYQQNSGEQLNLAVESTLPQVVYDTVLDKKNNHTLKIDESVKSLNPRWVLDINIKKILSNYVFANLKKFRTFEGVETGMLLDKNVNTSMNNYIKYNVLDRYKFTKIDFFYKPVDLLSIGQLKYNNTYDVNIEIFPNTLFTKIQTETDPEYNNVRVFFYQDKEASRYSFSYYFNIYYEKL